MSAFWTHAVNSLCYSIDLFVTFALVNTCEAFFSPGLLSRNLQFNSYCSLQYLYRCSLCHDTHSNNLGSQDAPQVAVVFNRHPQSGIRVRSFHSKLSCNINSHLTHYLVISSIAPLRLVSWTPSIRLHFKRLKISICMVIPLSTRRINLGPI